MKILLSNECVYDCKYCINRKSNDVKRASFTPEEICELTMQFYRRNYIEGLFLSSGIIQNPTHTMELLYQTLFLLRNRYRFMGYIHVKGIPGADPIVIEKTGYLADRMSVNLELPTREGLEILAPNKPRTNILKNMRQIQNGIENNKNDIVLYKNAPKFVSGGQSTQMIIGATKENDYQILSVAESLYEKFALKRVFYSAFIHVNEDKLLPAVKDGEGPPLLREHRLYQADWLLRFYGFKAQELLSSERPNFNIAIDPKADWAVRHLDKFPVEINRADYQTLLRVPGLGVTSAKRIVAARRYGNLNFEDLKKIGVVLKRAIFFITCNGKMMHQTKLEEDYIVRNEKLTRAKAQGICVHNDRKAKNHTNKDIDSERTRLNYYFKKNNSKTNELISRKGKGKFLRDYRPLLGEGVRDFCKNIGYGMFDSTVCDIYLINEYGELIGRPVLTACVDGYSSMCLGYSLGLVGGVKSLKKLIFNISNSCNLRCKYCYANYDENKVAIQSRKHNVNSSLLIGEIEIDDIIKERKK